MSKDGTQKNIKNISRNNTMNNIFIKQLSSLNKILNERVKWSTKKNELWKINKLRLHLSSFMWIHRKYRVYHMI